MNEIDQLKALVLQSKDLKEPFNYFFNLVDTNKILTMKGHDMIYNITDRPELLAMIDVMKNEMSKRLGITLNKLGPILFEIPDYHFIHGVCLANELFVPAAIIYFSDIHTGIFTTAAKQTEMFRFALMAPSEMKQAH